MAKPDEVEMKLAGREFERAVRRIKSRMRGWRQNHDFPEESTRCWGNSGDLPEGRVRTATAPKFEGSTIGRHSLVGTRNLSNPVANL
jgi:hypothetical protein